MEALSDDGDDRDNRGKAIPEITTFIPVIENKFGLDGAQVVKIIQKCSHRVWRYSKLEFKGLSSSRRELFFSSSSSFSTPPNREKN